MKRLSHVVGFDDGPFERSHRGNVLLVGAVFAGPRLEGVLSTRVRRDGANATRAVAESILSSRFHHHLQLVLLQGIAFAGFNVVDLHGLHHMLQLPVVTVARRRPDLAAMRRALLDRVRGGARKWALIEGAGPMEPVGGIYAQWCGLSRPEVEASLASLTVNGALPEPLRTAHLIAGGVTRGESRHRA